jgi:hypothetical protein
MELITPDPSFDGAIPHPELPQLLSRHYAVLSAGKRGNLPVPTASRHFAFYGSGNCRLVFHAADGETTGRTRGAHFVPIPST